MFGAQWLRKRQKHPVFAHVRVFEEGGVAARVSLVRPSACLSIYVDISSNMKLRLLFTMSMLATAICQYGVTGGLCNLPHTPGNDIVLNDIITGTSNASLNINSVSLNHRDDSESGLILNVQVVVGGFNPFEASGVCVSVAQLNISQSLTWCTAIDRRSQSLTSKFVIENPGMFYINTYIAGRFTSMPLVASER